MRKIKFQNDYRFTKHGKDVLENQLNGHFKDLPYWCTLGQFVFVEICGIIGDEEGINNSLGVVFNVRNDDYESSVDIAFSNSRRWKRFFFENGVLVGESKWWNCKFHPLRFERCDEVKWLRHCAKLDTKQAHVIWCSYHADAMETFDNYFIDNFAKKGIKIPWYIDGKACEDAYTYRPFYEFDLVIKMSDSAN